MKKITIVLALMLLLGTVFISGCATIQNNTQNNTGGNAQNKSPGIPGYSVGQVFSIESENSELNPEPTVYG